MANQTRPESQISRSVPDYDSQPTDAPATRLGLVEDDRHCIDAVGFAQTKCRDVPDGRRYRSGGDIGPGREEDVWLVVHDYFRMDLGSVSSALGSALAWIDFRILFPPSFFPEMDPIPWGYGFWFPSGWLIGFLLLLNLTAAHLIRFRIQGSGASLGIGLIVLLAGGLLTFAVVVAGSEQTATPLQLFTDWPSLRILWLLTQCTTASVVLLIGSLLVFHRLAGIVVLHAGVGLMMIGELVVGIAAVEGQMQIMEGQTSNFVMDTRKLELVVVDASDPREDDVVAVPESLLRGQPVVDDPQLPFRIELVDFQVNSIRQRANPNVPNPATAGIGLQQVAVPADPVGGTDMSGDFNRAVAYVQLSEKDSGEILGVYLLGLDDSLAGLPEKVQVDGKTYEISLRYKHMYKPYSLHLIDVEQDVYMGTRTAKSFSSHLRLVDPTRNVDRTVKIWMNNPLRFAGDTFYQSGYGSDPRTGLENTTLQVVTNTGWRIPYVSCMMLAVGMVAQFWITLGRYLQRRRSEKVDEPKHTPTSAVGAKGGSSDARETRGAARRQRQRPVVAGRLDVSVGRGCAGVGVAAVCGLPPGTAGGTIGFGCVRSPADHV